MRDRSKLFMYLCFINVCFDITMRQIVGELVNNESERCGRPLSWPNVNYQGDLKIISKNYSHNGRNPGRILNSKTSKMSATFADKFYQPSS
jgi:hypothetical protein